MLQRLIDRRNLYGIGFHQSVVLQGGAWRVWYVDRDTPVAQAFQEMVRIAMTGGIDANDPIWKLTPFVDKPGDYETGSYRFEWEREWRVPGGLRFKESQVALLFIPEDLHTQTRAFFEKARAEHFGPAYLCAYIDPRWKMDEIQAALAGLP